jgi:recombinational DNA repair ATPase RecF
VKLLELIIRNIRGVVQLTLRPDGKTFVIVGANGTGKSAVVDAIDFLLTGEMGRFTGRTGFKLQAHGKHLNATGPEQCLVEARVQVPNITGEVTLCRRFSSAGVLSVSPESARGALRPFLAVANERQYVLTRQNLLKFILAQPRDRAEQVQSLLSLARLETLRQALTSARNSAEQTARSNHAALISARGAAASTLKLASWVETAALNAVNDHRTTLRAVSTDSLADVRGEVDPPSAPPLVAANPATPPDAFADITIVGKSVAVAMAEQVDALDTTLLAELATLAADPIRLRAARQLELIDLGVTLLGDEQNCPLCDRDWEPGTLGPYLREKAAGGRSVSPSWERASTAARRLTEWLADKEAITNRIVEAGRQGENGIDPRALTDYATRLAELRAALVDFLGNYSRFRNGGIKLSEQIGITSTRDLLRELYVERKANAAKNPLQIAWDTLTRLGENLKAIDQAKKSHSSAVQSSQRQIALHHSFIRARDSTLGGLYNSVSQRFAELYRQLHAPDEADFSAAILPTETGLILSVGFHGLNDVAPHTLHSEGHQDSMGLCLFIALAEKMQGRRLEFCLLDDVVMAIDAGHRRQIARLLKSLESDTQFLIATHDVTWATQLKSEKCVTSAAITRFIGWSFDGGPVEGVLHDFITESKAALAKGNVRDAAASLRHGLEEFLHHVADALAARPPYSLSGQYEMGDMQSACSGRLKDLLKAAKSAAQSWRQTQAGELCAARDEERTKALQDAQIEQWAINPNVHYNSWMNMTGDEFQPVVVAFERFCKLFQCPKCHSFLTVIYEGAAEKSLTCSAGCQPLNLEKKS